MYIIKIHRLSHWEKRFTIVSWTDATQNEKDEFLEAHHKSIEEGRKKAELEDLAHYGMSKFLANLIESGGKIEDSLHSRAVVDAINKNNFSD